jgi:hypothetical protein
MVFHNKSERFNYIRGGRHGSPGRDREIPVIRRAHACRDPLRVLDRCGRCRRAELFTPLSHGIGA